METLVQKKTTITVGSALPGVEPCHTAAMVESPSSSFQCE